MKNGTVYKTKKRNAQSNMDFDAMLLANLQEHEGPILHLYDWEIDSITYGHFFKPEMWLNCEGIKKWGIDLVKRPTGGGCVFHMCDFAFSLLVPASFGAFSSNTLENYAFVNQMVIEVIARFLSSNAPSMLLAEKTLPSSPVFNNFCMAKPTKYDVMIEGKKVAGAAQRKTKEGYLHQGTIFLTPLPESYLKDLLVDKSVAEGIKNHSFPLLQTKSGNKATADELTQARKFLSLLFEEVFLEKIKEF